MQQQHREIDNQFSVAPSSNGDGRDGGPQALHVVDGSVTGTDGFDAASTLRGHHDEVTAAVTLITEHRAVIEQAKGMLMLIHGIDDPEAAFEVLRWRSQETNTKLRLLARQVVADFVALSRRGTRPPPSAYDRLLLTAHLRVDADTALEDEETG